MKTINLSTGSKWSLFSFIFHIYFVVFIIIIRGDMSLEVEDDTGMHISCMQLQSVFEYFDPLNSS